MGPRAFFSELFNLVHISYIGASIANAYFHSSWDPFEFKSKFLMIMILLVQIPLTFSNLKIFESFSKIVTMLKDVVVDLQVFLFFFTVLLIMLAMTFAVLGLGNENFEGKF